MALEELDEGQILQVHLNGGEPKENVPRSVAEEGHEVSFRNEDRASRVLSSKDVVTYTTTNHDDAYAWADKMSDEGYTVTIRFDKETGIYTCNAIK